MVLAKLISFSINVDCLSMLIKKGRYIDRYKMDRW